MYRFWFKMSLSQRYDNQSMHVDTKRAKISEPPVESQIIDVYMDIHMRIETLKFLLQEKTKKNLSIL